MDYSWYIYLLTACAGALAGGINTLAGSGSLITLPLLIFMGLPPGVANGTNRIGILSQTFVSSLTLWLSGKVNLKGSGWMIIPASVGAIAGANVATDLNEDVLNIIISFVMVLMLYLVLKDPGKWLRIKAEKGASFKSFSSVLLYTAVGFYGGFIQVGVGIFLLAVLVLVSGFTIVESNAVKNVIVFCYTLPALLVFVLHGQVDWLLGGLMAVGQSIGAWAASRFATRVRNANAWIRKLIILVITVSILKGLGIFKYLASGF